MSIFTTMAFAQDASLDEAISELGNAVNELAPQDAAVAGLTAGVVLGIAVSICVVWFILQVIADWKIFKKAGIPGWKSIIPFYNYYVEYGLCWNAMYGLVYAVTLYLSQYIQGGDTFAGTMKSVILIVLAVIGVVLHFKESMNLSKSFNKGVGFGVGLFLLGPIWRLALGFGNAKYVGNKS